MIEFKSAVFQDIPLKLSLVPLAQVLHLKHAKIRNLLLFSPLSENLQKVRAQDARDAIDIYPGHSG